MPGVHAIGAREVLSITEVMAQTKYTYSQIREAIRFGKLKRMYPGKKFLLHVSDVNRWIRDVNHGRS